MKSSASKIKMTSFDDLFGEEPIQNIPTESSIQEIALSSLVEFEQHPFKVLDDEKMEETKESVAKYGVLVPIIVRPKADNLYEIIAGHRRKRACELLELPTIPAIVRDLDDEESTIIMVDSNIQRENLLLSEKAFAYKMKLEAIKRKAGRPKNNARQVVGNSESADIVGKDAGESGRQVQRYIRLTELITPLLEMADERKLAFNTAVELSYLSNHEQELVLYKMEEFLAIPTLGQASKMKKYSNDGSLNEVVIDSILSESNDKPVQVTLKKNKIGKYFPKGCSSSEIEETILKLLDEWHKSR